ncbi:U3 small nucleolar RNA-associated protein 20 isoform X1 [Prosopis cineraria]|uniref:U3 small nucleolar RNA-associated protein 20 isoform X1 n=2 Tax=Prosopis cineraria TaxID=364024 RepID=UPI0024103A67|nr:U3 small nucleolar RNA-associated protein 20 isoform X1 [Prosopis cineraria]
MATSSVKSLNKSPGRRRFVFKTFYERIDDIDINVYQSLEKVKLEPSEGSSFFRDCLVEWRELNTAEDFISYYEEVMPYTQTLPLVLLHKESLISKLLSRLQLKARLSLEPIFRLIAALSRDLLEEFVPLLPRIVGSLVSLLESGADRDPEIIEWMFISWSYIMMYLQKYLIYDTLHVLKATAKLRYYPKEYIQQFMAEAVSFVLRNAPDEHLKRGIGRVMLEAVKKPSPCRESGVQALLYHVMTVSSLRLHSKAERVLKLLTSKAIYSIGDKDNQESSTVLEIVKSIFEKLCEMMEPKELNQVWECLYEEVRECACTGGISHLRCLLSVLISAVKAHNGRKVLDYKPMLELVLLLVRMYITTSGMIKSQDDISLVIDRILKLMLGILNGLRGYIDKSLISECALQWAPVFKLQSSSLLHFIRELLLMEHCLHAFRGAVLSAIDDLMENSEEEVIYLLQSFCEEMQLNVQKEDFVDGTSAEALARISSHLQGIINKAISYIAHCEVSCQIDEGKLALLWGAVSCYSHMSVVKANPSLLVDLVNAVDHLVKVKPGYIADSSKKAWESIIGAALSSYDSLCRNSSCGVDATEKFLSLAKSYRSSSRVLSAVADHLESKYGSPLEEAGYRKIHSEIEERIDSVVTIFADNLSHPDKGIRISTLKILCLYKFPDREIPSAEQMAKKRRKTELSHISSADRMPSNVLQLLLSIETTPISIATSRCIQRVISKIQMDLSAGRISEVYVPLVLNGLLGILNNRFSYLWNPALECLAVLISQHFALVWDNFVCYLERCQLISQTFSVVDHCVNVVLPDRPTGLCDSFQQFVNCASDSTPCVTILSLLLQCLQKIATVVESRSRQFIPLFLKFLGYNTGDLVSVGLFDNQACKGKAWKTILKEWLNLLKLMKNPKSFYWSQFLKEVLQNRLMEENDPEIQMKVLDCLLTWKDDYLVPYDQHLRNLITSKNLREELTTWSLSREAGTIEECHRMHLVPLVIRLLMPKVRMLRELASRKNASIYHRKAILQFIAEVDVNELPIFFALMIKPLQIVNKTDGPAKLFWTLPGGSVSEFQASSLLEYFTSESIAGISLKKRYAFLHVIEDFLGVFDDSHVRPFLDLLMGCVVRVLGSCASGLDNAKLNEFPSDQSDSGTNSFSQRENVTPVNKILTTTTLKQFKDMRSLCLKIVSFVLNKYEDHEFGSDLWDFFFASVKPLIDRFKQEAASSEKPSSLFSCFLAMGRNNNLVALLCREESLVSDIYSILRVKSASEAVIVCVLKFVNNLLNLDNELDDEENPAQRVLHSNIVGLVDSLCFLFGNDTAAKRKLVKSPGEMVINILKFLPKYIKDADLARHFVDILLLFIEKKSLTSDACAEVLQVIQNFIPILGNGCATKILNAICPLYVLAELDMRLRVCDLLDTLAASDMSILLVAKLLRQLNATASSMGWLNHDAILEAYESINSDFFRKVEADHALLVLSHCVHDMSSKELTFVVSACSSLLSFVDFSALIFNKEGNSDGELSVMRDTDGCWTRSCIQRITNKFLLKHMADSMDGVLSVRKGWIKLLRQMVLKLPEVSNFKSLVALCSEDEEVDFFNNIVDSKMHRRVRALSRFRNIISMNKMSEGIIKKVFLPLFFNMLFDEQEGKAEHMKNACIETIASVAGQMEWKSYYALLNRCFRGMSSSPDKQKVFIRLICSILDRYHFSEISHPKEPSLGSDSDFGTAVTSSSAASGDSGNSVVDREIQACLSEVVFPKIQKLINSDSEKINVNISLAALKLLKLLPADVMDLHLSSIVHRISNFLKSHLESIRDEARSALATCLKELGLEYLQFIVKVLQATLKRGYELHVLGYTLNFILSKCLLNPVNGKLDYCLEDLLYVIEMDILGDVAEEKEVEKIASKMKETRRKKSFETLKLIAQNVTFKSNALKLLAPVTAQTQNNITPKVKSKLENMLQHIATGIECNPSVDETDLFIFIYGLVEDGIKGEICKPGNKSINMVDKPCIDSNKKSTSRGVEFGSLCSHLIRVFALRILHKHMKGMKQDMKDANILSLLDPFVRILSECLCSKYEDILSASLGCLTLLVRLPLPSLESQAERLKAALLNIAHTTVNSSSPLMQSCLTLLTVLLRSTKITLTSDQLHHLIQLPLFVDLERNQSPVALSLLKGIVNRRLVVPEIYDLITRVAELMVTSQLESIRKKCSKILLQFLLDYRLAGKRLQQHLDSLLANLRYEYSTGRKSVLEMIHAVIVKFPRSVLDEQSQTLFVHLVACLANDNDNSVRSMSGAAIKELIGSISPNSLNSILEYALSWYLGEKQQLWGAAAQVLGLLIEILKKGFYRHVNCILPVTHRILQSSIDVITDREVDFADSIIPHWKEAYYSLVMLEKLIHQFRELCFAGDLEVIWDAICQMLLHPHSWIRNRSVHLIAQYFTHVVDACKEHQKSLANYYLMSPSNLFHVAASLCCQLKTPPMDDTDANLMNQSIVFAICGVHSVMGLISPVDPAAFWSALEQHEKDRFLKAFDLLDSRKGRNLFLLHTSSVHEQNNQQSADNLQHVLVSVLLRKMGKIAFQMETYRMGIVFNIFKSVMSQISQDDVLHYASEVLLPLYKVCEGFAGKVIPDNVKQLAEESLEKVQNILGTQNFVQVYNLIGKKLKAKRDKKKQEEKIMAVINPMRNAKRKMRISAKNRANKKRKILTLKMARWMH